MAQETPLFPAGEDVSASTAAGLLVALAALPALVFVTTGLDVEVSTAASIAVKWLLAGLLVAVVFGWEGRDLSAVGLRRPEWSDLGYAVVAFVLGLAAFVATDPLIEALGLERAAGTGLDPTGAVAVALAGAVTAGVVEELLFRGYAIERLTELAGSAPAAGAVSWAAFTIAHAPSYPAGNLFQISIAALVFTLVYLHGRSLLPLVVGHALIDVVGVLGAVYG